MYDYLYYTKAEIGGLLSVVPGSLVHLCLPTLLNQQECEALFQPFPFFSFIRSLVLIKPREDYFKTHLYLHPVLASASLAAPPLPEVSLIIPRALPLPIRGHSNEHSDASGGRLLL